MIMHVRDATEDHLAIMREHKPKGVVHCFSGSAETAEQLLDMGLYIGFTGVLTFKNAKKQSGLSPQCLPTDFFLKQTARTWRPSLFAAKGATAA